MTRTSMPWCRTSTAKPAAKADKKALVPEYNVVNGEHMAAAAEEVNTIPPRFLLATCSQQLFAIMCQQKELESWLSSEA